MGKEFAKKSSSINSNRLQNLKSKKFGFNPIFQARNLLPENMQRIMHHASNSISGSQIIQRKTKNLPDIPNGLTSPELRRMVSNYNAREIDLGPGSNNVKIYEDLRLLLSIELYLSKELKRLSISDSILNLLIADYLRQLKPEILAVNAQLGRECPTSAAMPIPASRSPSSMDAKTVNPQPLGRKISDDAGDDSIDELNDPVEMPSSSYHSAEHLMARLPKGLVPQQLEEEKNHIVPYGAEMRSERLDTLGDVSYLKEASEIPGIRDYLMKNKNLRKYIAIYFDSHYSDHAKSMLLIIMNEIIMADPTNRNAEYLLNEAIREYLEFFFNP